jgi:hypothetical protein
MTVGVIVAGEIELTYAGRDDGVGSREGRMQ